MRGLHLPRERLIPVPPQGPLAPMRAWLDLSGRELACLGVGVVGSAAPWVILIVGH